MEFDRQKPYSVLGEDEVRLRMEKEIEALSGTLSVSESVATVLLARHGWDLDKVYDSWVFDDDEYLLKSGLKPLPSHFHEELSESESKCGICFEIFTEKSCELICTPFCVHRFCRNCWGGYIRNYMNENFSNPSKLSCPAQDCKAAVGPDTVNLLCETDMLKYRTSLIRSYVERKSEIKWCPAAGCENAFELQNSEDADECFDVVCRCSHMFCWNCLLESHRPVTCNIASDWFRTGADESLSLNWIVANTKPCPNCFRPIERDRSEPGCDMMVCAAPCGFVFCWICLKSWIDHHKSGFCIANEANLPDGMTEEAYERWDLVASSSQKYSYCCDGWEVNSVAIEKAVLDLRKLETFQMEIICRKFNVDRKDLGFLREAWMLVCQCRQVLKWSYVYDLFLSDYENAKKQYLRHLQEAAVTTLKLYFDNLEKEMKEAVNGKTESFSIICNKVTNLVHTTGNHFYHFVKTIEEGLPEVSVTSYVDVAGAHWFCDRCTFQNSWLDKECQVCYEDLAVLEDAFDFPSISK